MGEFTALVRRLMDERGLTLRKLALKAGYSDHTLLSKVLNGKKPLTPYMAASLDRALEADGVVVTAGELAMATASAVRLPLRELADHAAELSAWAESGTAGPGTIAVLDEEVKRLIREHSSSPPGPLILRASEVCRRASGLLRQHQRLRHARDLMVVASRCCAFLAVTLGDIGQQAEAASYARTALTLAEEASDQGSAALALSALSKVAFWDGHRDDAAVLAMRGYELAGGEGSLRVLLACQAADASPVAQAHEAIGLARVALDSAPPPQPGVFSCGRVRAAGYRGSLALREGDFPGVLAAAAESDAALLGGETASFGSLTQTRINSSIACLANGDPDQAAEWLAPVIALPADMRLATFTGKMAYAARLAGAAPYEGSPAARDLADALHGYLGFEPEPMPYPNAIGAAK